VLWVTLDFLGVGANEMNFLVLAHNFSCFQAQPATPPLATTQHHAATTQHKAKEPAVRRFNVSLKPKLLQPTSSSSNLKWWLYRLIAPRLLFFLYRSRQNFYFCFKIIEKNCFVG